MSVVRHDDQSDPRVFEVGDHFGPVALDRHD
jgi:hypothetical protein